MQMKLIVLQCLQYTHSTFTLSDHIDTYYTMLIIVNKQFIPTPHSLPVLLHTHTPKTSYLPQCKKIEKTNSQNLSIVLVANMMGGHRMKNNV